MTLPAFGNGDWIQSLVRSDEKRQILLRQQLQAYTDANLTSHLVKATLIDEQLDKLDKRYHNLLRLCMEC